MHDRRTYMTQYEQHPEPRHIAQVLLNSILKIEPNRKM